VNQPAAESLTTLPVFALVLPIYLW